MVEKPWIHKGTTLQQFMNKKQITNKKQWQNYMYSDWAQIKHEATSHQFLYILQKIDQTFIIKQLWQDVLNHQISYDYDSGHVTLKIHYTITREKH